MRATAPPHLVAKPSAALTTERGDSRPDAFATGKASAVGSTARRGNCSYSLRPTAYTGRPSASWLTLLYRRASNNSRSTIILPNATQASSTMPSPNTLRRTAQPTTTTLPMAPYTAYNTKKGDLARPYTARTNDTDVGRPWVLLDVPGHKQEETGVVRRVKTPAYTKKEKEKAHTHRKGESMLGPTPCSPGVRSGMAPSPDQAGSPDGSVLGGAGRMRAGSTAVTNGGTPAGR